MIVCTDCGTEKPEEAFVPKIHLGRLTKKCDVCRDRRAEEVRKWNARHPGVSAGWHREYRKRTGYTKSALNKAAQARYRATHKADRYWTKTLRNLRSETAALLTKEEWQETLEVHDHRCAYCLRKLTKLEQDHVVSLDRGGEHTQDNVVPCCRSCNATKGPRPVFLMAAYIAA